MYHCKKGFVISTIIFFTRVATVDVVLWKDTRIVPHDNQLWAAASEAGMLSDGCLSDSAMEHMLI